MASSSACRLSPTVRAGRGTASRLGHRRPVRSTGSASVRSRGRRVASRRSPSSAGERRSSGSARWSSRSTGGPAPHRCARSPTKWSGRRRQGRAHGHCHRTGQVAGLGPADTPTGSTRSWLRRAAAACRIPKLAWLLRRGGSPKSALGRRLRARIPGRHAFQTDSRATSGLDRRAHAASPLSCPRADGA